LVSFSNFRMLDPETADVARELIGEGDRQHSAFLPFMNVWMGFNGWMESVTDATSDAAMITALADNRRMTDAYDALIASDRAFRRGVVRFAELWPVLSVRDLRKRLGRDAFWQMERVALLEACRRADVRLQPLGWVEGEMPTWPQIIRTIYQIRCNLFHGAKSPQHIRDRDLVRHADRVLRGYINGSDCFDWHD
jgi:hypothetical protein